MRRGGGARLAAMLLAALAAAPAAPAQLPNVQTLRIIPVWPGAARGTTDWSGPEIELDADLPAGKTHIITNVTVPTLSVFKPTPGTATGAAMIVVPGGAFRALPCDLEGTEIANWLARHGITAFVLKYRVRPPGASAPAGPETFDHFLVRTTAARASADATQALKILRARADNLGIDPHRVGMIGFSAGAITTLDVATGGSSRPDYVVSAYGAMPDRRARAPPRPCSSSSRATTRKSLSPTASPSATAGPPPTARPNFTSTPMAATASACANAACRSTIGPRH